jgi:ligand-binding sensor domain-containing protein
MWIGTSYGLVKYDVVTNQSIHYLPEGLQPVIPGKHAPGSFISNIFIESLVSTETDSGTCLWIAAQWGLNRFYADIEQFDHFLEDKSDPNSISTSFLKELYLDDTGLLWIGTPSSGIEVLNTMPNPFKNGIIKFSNDGNDTYPACFLCDDEDMLWIGATDGGLFQYDKISA